MHAKPSFALTLDLGLSAAAAGSCCIFTLAVRQPPVLASCIEIYYISTAGYFSVSKYIKNMTFEEFSFKNFCTRIKNFLNKILVEKNFLDALLYVKFF